MAHTYTQDHVNVSTGHVQSKLVDPQQQVLHVCGVNLYIPVATRTYVGVGCGVLS